MAERGAKVVINYNTNADDAQAVVKQIEEAGGQAQAVQANIGVVADSKRLIETAVKAFGRLDILVNNAGITRDNLLMRMSEDDIHAVIDTNLKGAIFCAQAALRPLLKAKGGRIINISSVSGQAGSGGQANYSAAKAGLIGLTKSLAREYASPRYYGQCGGTGLY